ncbi:hypothetical protein Q4610_16440 [Sphingobium sp. HBC34]|uniref:Uncharacterized protein n=1 Tax=Sphingobium cyanobacteriorum TaxID=3063954 RepID=A0ABT8ZT50_9SPHN|nr:hypothetical protein [Sphingobium sp. HBC34]MDO7836636.1 hypothetical protein [Sphingobium sp. HBC34]
MVAHVVHAPRLRSGHIDPRRGDWRMACGWMVAQAMASFTTLLAQPAISPTLPKC